MVYIVHSVYSSSTLGFFYLLLGKSVTVGFAVDNHPDGFYSIRRERRVDPHDWSDPLTRVPSVTTIEVLVSVTPTRVETESGTKGHLGPGRDVTLDGSHPRQ